MYLWGRIFLKCNEKLLFHENAFETALAGSNGNSVSRRRSAVTLKATFGANVRHYRQAKDLKQHELAEAIDKTTGMVGKIERGQTGPSFNTVEKIAAALDVPEVVLFATTPMSVPTGERGKLLQRIHVQLAKLNNAELARAVKMLKALE
jgi:transcriptional regulator with XRE-family HTH domain